MNLKTATLFAMVSTSLEALIALVFFLAPNWRPDQHNIIINVFKLVHLVTYTSWTLFFFSLYTKQQKG